MVASPRIFVSYSRRDRAWVQAFVRDLRSLFESAGRTVEVFTDAEIEGGERWVARLQTELQNSSAVVLVGTRHAMASPWVTRELASALGRPNVCLIPLLFPDSPDLPPLALDHQATFVSAAAGYQKALAAVAARVFPSKLAMSVTWAELADAFDSPALTDSPWPAGLRARAVECLVAVCDKEKKFRSWAEDVELPQSAFESLVTKELRASALLLAGGGQTDELSHAAKLLRDLADYFEDSEKILEQILAVAEAVEQVIAASKAISAARSSEPPLQTYLRWMRDRPLALADPFGDSLRAATRQKVYVPLQVEQKRANKTAAHGRSSVEGKGGHASSLEGLEPGELREMLIRGRQVYEQDRWVVRGDPGAGKTTLLWNLARETAASALQAEQAGSGCSWVPVVVSLVDLLPSDRSQANRPQPNRPQPNQPHPNRPPPELLDCALASFAATGDAPAVRGAISGLAAPRRLLLLLDGLDEISVAQSAVDLISQLCRKWAGRATIVVSSRHIPYKPPGPDFVPLDLVPFGPAEWRSFLTQWCQEHPSDERTWTVDEMVERIAEHRELRHLAEVPLLLMLIACLLDAGKPLVDNRAALYEHYFLHLLEGRHRRMGDQNPLEAVDEVLDVLAGLGLSMTRDNVQQLAEPELKRRLQHHPDVRPAWQALQREAPSEFPGPRDFVDQIRDRSTILVLKDEVNRKWGFGHRSYAEALTALALRHNTPEQLTELVASLEGDASAWSEPLALAVGRSDNPDALVLALAESKHPALAYRALATAPRLLANTVEAVLDLPTDDLEKRREAILCIPRLLEATPKDAVDLLVGLIGRALHHGLAYADELYFVNEALDLIKKRKDSHHYVKTKHRAMMDALPEPPAGQFERIFVPHQGKEIPLRVPIESGTFWMGSPESERGDAGERPRHRVTITELQAAMAVPVTNAMFQAFDPAFSAYPWDDVPTEELRLHPAVNVSWYAASAFCQWLRHKSVAGWENARLPTEAQWECLARAGSETAYCSGDGDAALRQVGWFHDNSDGRTHQVGGLSPNHWGIYDAHGNVDEWCADCGFRDYPNSPEEDPRGPDSGVDRVVRGGSWFDSAGFCRSAVRLSWHPSFRHRHRGFRVVAAVAPERDGGS